MFFQRRRLQVLASILVIVASLLYLGGELDGGASPLPAATLSHQDSQLGEGYFLLRHSYVRELREEPLLEAAAGALRTEAVKRGVPPEQLPAWAAVEQGAGDSGLRRVEDYLQSLVALGSGRWSEQDAVYVALGGMTQSLRDPYTLAMDPATFARFQTGLHGHSYGGIGLELEWSRKAFIVFEIVPGSPADASGIKAGDTLLTVDGKPLLGQDRDDLALEKVRLMLAGEVGSQVRLTLSRGGSAFSRTLKRAVFETRTVKGRLLGDSKTTEEPPVGWIRVQTMGEATGQEMAETLLRLSKGGAVGYVLDLRDNVGGYLNGAVELASMFLPSGEPVVTIEGREGKRAKHTIGGQPVTAPLVVLVNSRTASSAEILGGALQDYGRAVLLGERTFGKGSVQTLHDFADGGGFKMTTARYLTPKGRVLEGQGLTPDVTIDVGQSRDEETLQRDVLSYCRTRWTTKASTP